MLTLITGTPQFCHYCTIVPTIAEYRKTRRITEIITPGLRKNGIDCAVRIFSHFNEIPCKTLFEDPKKELKDDEMHEEVYKFLHRIKQAIIFWDGSDYETKMLIDLVYSKQIPLHIVSVPVFVEKWYHKIKKKKYAHLS